MIEVALGGIAAALVAKALDRAGEKAVDQGEGALQRLVKLVRGQLPETDAGNFSDALKRVEDTPDSPSRVEALANQLNDHAKSNPAFRRELAALVDEASESGLDVGDIVQATYRGQSPQFGLVSNSAVKVTYGDQGDSKKRTRRISE